MRKATAAQDCKGQILARDLLLECEASGQMTPEQAYQHWLAGELGHNNKDGGMCVEGDDSTRLASDRCSVCAGRCPSPEACHLPTVESYGMGWSLGWLAFFAAVGVGCLVMAARTAWPF